MSPTKSEMYLNDISENLSDFEHFLYMTRLLMSQDNDLTCEEKDTLSAMLHSMEELCDDASDILHPEN